MEELTIRDLSGDKLPNFVKEELPEGCSAKLKIDGIYVIGDSWNFLQPTNDCVAVKFPLVVREVQKNRIKASQTFNSSKRIWFIKLANVMDFKLQLMFYTKEDQRLNYSSLLSLVRRAIQTSLSKHEGSETWAADLQEVYKCVDRTAGEKKIRCCDFLVFGALLRHEVSQFIRTHAFADDGIYNLGLTDIDFKFMAWNAGQSADYHMVVDNCLSHLSIRYIEEIILHTAIDVNRHGFTALWNRDKLSSYFGKQPNYEYYPVGIPGHGNFYFHSRSQPEMDGEAKIGLAKFYSSVAKFFHAQTPKPFSKAQIAEALLISGPSSLLPKRERKQHKVDLERFVKEAKTALDFCNEGISETNDARLELVTSIRRPNFNYQQSCIEALGEFLTSHVFRGLAFVESYVIHQRLRRYLVPAIGVISYHLENHKKRENCENQELLSFSLSKFIWFIFSHIFKCNLKL